MRKIKNFDELATTNARRAALEIAEAGLAAIDTTQAIRSLVRLEDSLLTIGGRKFALDKLGKIVIGGVGKCALAAAEALEDILGDRVSHGVALYIAGEPKLKKIKAIKGTHPLPSEENMRGAKMLIDNVSALRENDLVIFVVSGGGSTLLCFPEGMGFREEASIMQALTRAGAAIQEINTVRKHLSLARGGYLTKYAYPANTVSLIFSDVPGNDIQFVASGPTVKDTTTIAEAELILKKYNILNMCGIEKCGLMETPKEDKYFARAEHIIAVSNKVALNAMEKKAKELGLNPVIRDQNLFGEAREVGHKILNELRRAPSKAVFLYGGETTVTVKGGGRGGRNLELALAALAGINGEELIMPFTSDGRDNSDLAGAICDIITKKKADDARIAIEKYLGDNNSYPFFRAVGNYIETGDTGSNVSDLIIALKT